MFKLPDHVSAAYNEARGEEDRKKAVFANMSDGDLAASAKFWMQHCVVPKRFSPNESVYDATMWHVILPEMIRRISKS
jgi:hypothetical protein